jgi:hypothetical protein
MQKRQRVILIELNALVVIYRIRSLCRMAFVKRAFRRKYILLAAYSVRDKSVFFRPKNKMPDVDLENRHPALQSMCSKD